MQYDLESGASELAKVENGGTLESDRLRSLESVMKAVIVLHAVCLIVLTLAGAYTLAFG